MLVHGWEQVQEAKAKAFRKKVEGLILKLSDILKAMGVVVGWCTARTRRDEINLINQWNRYARRRRFWKRSATK